MLGRAIPDTKHMHMLPPLVIASVSIIISGFATV